VNFEDKADPYVRCWERVHHPRRTTEVEEHGIDQVPGMEKIGLRSNSMKSGIL
jgi:hypothetical protein